MPSSLPCRQALLQAFRAAGAASGGWAGTEQALHWPVRARGQPSALCCLLCGQSATWGLKEPSGGGWAGAPLPGVSARPCCQLGWGPVNTKLAHVPSFPNTLRISRMGLPFCELQKPGLNMGQVGGQTLVMKSHSARLEVAVLVKKLDVFFLARKT